LSLLAGAHASNPSVRTTRTCERAWLLVSLPSGVCEPFAARLSRGGPAAGPHRPATWLARGFRSPLHSRSKHHLGRAFRCLFFSWLAFRGEVGVSHKPPTLATTAELPCTRCCAGFQTRDSRTVSFGSGARVGVAGRSAPERPPHATPLAHGRSWERIAVP